MPNSLLSPSLITKELLMRFKNSLGFASVVRQEQRDWWNEGGAKKGDSITIRKPVRFETRTGQAYVASDVDEDGVQLSLTTQRHVDFEFSSKDLTLTVERFGERYLTSAAVALANAFEVDGLTKAYQSCPQYVGTPAAVPTDNDIYLEAVQRIYDYGCPVDDNLFTTVNPKMQRKIVKADSTLFHAGSELAKQYKRGRIGVAHGSTWGISQNIRTHTVGSLAGSGLVNGVPANGATTIATDDWTASSVGVLKKGDILQFDSVYKVNPVSGDQLSDLMSWVVTADCDSDAGGAITVPIYPPIITSGPKKNCSAAPANDIAVQVFSHASTYASAVTPQGLTYHSEPV